MNKNILFRADSSSNIGIGHIIRDLVLADQFKNDKVIFACQDLDGNIISKIPYEVSILSSNYKEEFVSLIKKKEIDLLIIDHYEIDDKYEKYLKYETGVKILSFDGNYRKHYCDFLLNQNIYADKNKYQDKVPSFCKVFCGLEYALIRDEFREIKKIKLQKKSQSITLLLTLGGADPKNDTLKIMQLLEDISDKSLNIIVVVGRANTHLKLLEKFINASCHSYCIIKDAKNMAELMEGIDFAISSAGSTTIELLYMKVPFFTLSIAPNQDLSYHYLIEHKLAYDVKNLKEKLSKLISSNFKLNNKIDIGMKKVAQEIIL